MTSYRIPSPLVPDAPAAHHALGRGPVFAQGIDLAHDVVVAVVGVGSARDVPLADACPQHVELGLALAAGVAAVVAPRGGLGERLGVVGDHGLVVVVVVRVLDLDVDLARHEDGAQVGAQHGPEDGHRGADGRHVDLEDAQEQRDGAVPRGIVRGGVSRLVLDDGLKAPYGEETHADESNAAPVSMVG